MIGLKSTPPPPPPRPLLAENVREFWPWCSCYVSIIIMMVYTTGRGSGIDPASILLLFCCSCFVGGGGGGGGGGGDGGALIWFGLAWLGLVLACSVLFGVLFCFGFVCFVLFCLFFLGGGMVVVIVVVLMLQLTASDSDRRLASVLMLPDDLLAHRC